MEKLSNELKIALPYGANYKTKKTAFKIINKYNLNKLLMCSKVNFKNTASIINDYYNHHKQ
jgi:ribonuclease HIII